MSRAPAVLLLSLALAGCAATPQARLASDPAFKPARYAWDGAGEDPNQPSLATAPSYAARSTAMSSRAQDGVGDGMDADQDTRLNRSLVICKGCLHPQPTDDARLAKASN
jgi:hypothetical protein